MNETYIYCHCGCIYKITYYEVSDRFEVKMIESCKGNYERKNKR